MPDEPDARWWDVLVKGERVGVLWRGSRGGYTLRTGPSLIRPTIHHFSPSEGIEGVNAYIALRFGGEPELRPGDAG